ncbi:MAG: NifU family protein [Brumimicrobium sp.]
MEKFPVSIHAAVTPNPNTIKFVADKMLMDPPESSADFRSREEAVGYSPLAVAIFDKFDFVRGVYISHNFVSITKDNAEMAWDYLQVEVRNFLWDFITDGKPLIVKLPAERPFPTESVRIPEYAPSPFDDKIKKLMKQFVNNPVMSDGGEIIFRNFKDGIVTVLLKGACVNCPARNKTLKQGIEDILNKHIPEVKEVVSENDLLGDENQEFDESMAKGKSRFSDGLDFSAFDNLPGI